MNSDKEIAFEGEIYILIYPSSVKVWTQSTSVVHR